jgi:aldehyde dehydrogenase (NAD+)
MTQTADILPAHIDGKWVEPATSETIDVINPATEELAFQVADASWTDLDAAIGAARVAFDKGPWPRMTHTERAAYLHKIADELDRGQNALSDLWTTEVGVINTLARATAGFFFGNAFRMYANMAETFEFQEVHPPTAGGSYGLLVREPVGVVGAIVPWNGPLPLVAVKVAPALLAGCTVVVKMAPEAPGSAYALAEIAERIGLPPGVINVVTAERDVSELLVRDPRVDKISFTGSLAAGQKIASICGERIARVTLELGGKSAAMVLDDYDVGSAADAIAAQGCLFSGQSCGTLTRVLVSRNRHDEMVEALAARFAAITVGDPWDAGTQMGPLTASRQLDRVQGYIAKGIDGGARVATGGGRPADLDRGYFIEPTVFANFDNSSVIAQEEIFGPVLSVIPVGGDEQMIDVANASNYGLNASVFTNDVDRGYRFARGVRSGTVGQNSHRTDYGIAYGGFRQSGLGREGGVEGLRPYLEAKTVILEGRPS